MQIRRFFALLPLVACTAGGDIAPKSGEWTYQGSQIVSNTCRDGDAPTDPDGSFTLTVTADGKFTVDDTDFDEPFSCSQDGDDFDCPKRLAGTVMEDGIDAVGAYNVSVEGSFESSTELSGTQTVEITCTGEDCPLLQSIAMIKAVPCSYSYTFTATAR